MSRSGRVIAAAAAVLIFAMILWWRMHASVPVSDNDQASTGAPADAPVPEVTAPEIDVELPPQPEASVVDGSENEPVTINDVTTMQALFMSLAGQLEGPMREWAETRGMPREDPNGNFMLEQPYQQYDDETLQALARNGDMWAQQILADRIAQERPAEAMELYRQAATSGSVFAMLKLAELSGEIALMSPDFEFEGENAALEQYYSLRDAPVSPEVTAYAWNTVAEMAGLQGLAAMVGGSRPTDALAAAGCQLASSIYTDLLEQRSANGLGGYPTDPPPFWFDTEQLGARRAACEHEQAVSYDFSACKVYVVQNPQGGEEVKFYVCDDS